MMPDQPCRTRSTDVAAGLTDAEVGQYKEAGYTIVPGFFAPAEIAALKREVDRWVAAGLPRDVSIAETKRNLQLIPVWPHSRLFRAVPFHPKVVAAVATLLGDPVVKILDQMFYKPAGDGMGTNWHTDNAYFRIPEPIRGCAMWIAIDDATRENGTLKVIPGVYERELLHARDPDSDHHIRTHVDESDAVHCELEAGGVVLFCFGTPHATGSNRSARGRAGVGIHFVNLDHASDEMRAGDRWQHVHLTGEAATGGKREYGETVSFAAEVGQCTPSG